MKNGIVYCGGCNPRYDRVEFVNSLKRDFAKVDFTYASMEECYDLLIVVCGCSAACVNVDAYSAGEIIFVSSSRSIEAYHYLKEKG
ncbi:hypothetical protein ACS3UN_01880 [Oscillospiraceae bacterium LTW-04]|nr:hypothetical protein RBH76_08580 [Oscillospiraceae bacterium MB24-C1]